MLRETAAAIAALLLTACTAASLRPTEGSLESRKRELVEVDRAFSRLSESKGMREAFLAFAAPEAVMFRANASPIEGVRSIGEALAQTEGLVLTWEPRLADVASSGDLGYTWGVYELRSRAPDGAPRRSSGHYVSVWRRQPDGAWKWVLDIGNPGPRER